MRAARGFTLVEVLVALLVLSVVLTISMAAFLERNRRLQQASEIILAYQALANEAEIRRRQPYGNLEDEKPAFVTSTEILAPLGDFGTAVKVELESPGVKRVTMTVRWRNGEREARLALLRVETGGSNFW